MIGKDVLLRSKDSTVSCLTAIRLLDGTKVKGILGPTTDDFLTVNKATILMSCQRSLKVSSLNLSLNTINTLVIVV
ncbi:MAG: hypothetical protein ACOX3R_10315 [Desulfitobacteriia bacterium]|jgi:hypothetical protein